MRIYVDTNSLHFSQPGPIWGTICIAWDKKFFPNEVWDDIVFGVLEMWGDSLVKLWTGDETAATFEFMDGPVSFEVITRGTAAIFRFPDGEPVVPDGTEVAASLDEVVRSYVEVSRATINAVERMLRGAEIPLGDRASVEFVKQCADQLSRARFGNSTSDKSTDLH